MEFLTSQPIDVAMVGALVLRPGHGAVTTFVGHVRDHHLGRVVTRLDYSAYGPMAEREMAQVVADACSRWDVAVEVRHRIGMLEIGDVAIAVAVGSGHRDAGFAACRFVVDEVKRRVPIWKREWFTDGTSEWVDPTGQSSLGDDPAEHALG